MKPLKCHICNRAVTSTTRAIALKLAKEEGWKGTTEYHSCPEHRRDAPIKNYWRMRDILEATSREGRLRNVPVINYQLRRERVG